MHTTIRRRKMLYLTARVSNNLPRQLHQSWMVFIEKKRPMLWAIWEGEQYKENILSISTSIIISCSGRRRRINWVIIEIKWWADFGIILLQSWRGMISMMSSTPNRQSNHSIWYRIRLATVWLMLKQMADIILLCNLISFQWYKWP